MTRDLAKKSLLGKARARPDQLRQVLEKIRSEGLLQTYTKVRARLDTPMSMGYCSAGVVLAVGRDVQEFKPGDRVASNGPHAEVVAVSRRLCAKVPENIPFDQAAFSVLGAIAMQGFRLSESTLGETVFIIGLGIVGQLAVAIAHAAGCRVYACDPDVSRCELAESMGALQAKPGLDADFVASETGGLGADAVLIAASTSSKQPVDLAAAAVRPKGRVVLLGVVGLELDRRPFYFKEAEFVVSCSYGPGRYQSEYEDLGRDYPAAYVRWTEQRNLSSVLTLMFQGKLDVRPLISHRFSLDDSDTAYSLIENSDEQSLGVVFEYPGFESIQARTTVQVKPPKSDDGRLGLGFLGAGLFARSVLLPAIKDLDRLRPVMIASASGASANQVAEANGFEVVTTDQERLFSDPAVQVIFSVTPHNEHAEHVVSAIHSGKAIFVEKPLCITLEELRDIDLAIEAAGNATPLIMVGFNRRFAPGVRQLLKVFEGVASPRTVSIRFNAGQLPEDHWTQIDEIGGGRIIGEACHAIDLATLLVGSPPVRVFAESVGPSGSTQITDDQCFITLRHANGGLSNVAYLAGGDAGMPKERIEVLGGGRSAVLDDYRQLTTYIKGRSKTVSLGKQDKGHRAEVREFVRALSEGGGAPIAWSDIRAASLASILAVQCLRMGVPIDLASYEVAGDESEQD